MNRVRAVLASVFAAIILSGCGAFSAPTPQEITQAEAARIAAQTELEKQQGQQKLAQARSDYEEELRQRKEMFERDIQFRAVAVTAGSIALLIMGVGASVGLVYLLLSAGYAVRIKGSALYARDGMYPVIVREAFGETQVIQPQIGTSEVLMLTSPNVGQRAKALLGKGDDPVAKITTSTGDPEMLAASIKGRTQVGMINAAVGSIEDSTRHDRNANTLLAKKMVAYSLNGEQPIEPAYQLEPPRRAPKDFKISDETGIRPLEISGTVEDDDEQN